VMQTATANASQLNGSRVFNRSIVGELLAQQNIGSTAQTLIPLADAQASVRVMADATGNSTAAPSLLATQNYEGYGAATDAISGASLSANNAALTAFGYDGEQVDVDTGLVYLRARWYDPADGRFLSVDPHPGSMRTVLTLNDYAFAISDPVNNIDPSGKFFITDATASQMLIGINSGIATPSLISFSTKVAVTLVASVGALITVSAPYFIEKYIEECLKGGPKNSACNPPRALLVLGKDVREHTQHVKEAQLSGLRAVLHYSPNSSGRWYRNKPECKNGAAGTDCDEYPFGKTIEGGPNNYDAGMVSLKRISSVDNQLGGSYFSAMLRVCGLSGGSEFAVVPTGLKQSGYICGRK
jgi:RHS repeat-associated protein